MQSGGALMAFLGTQRSTWIYFTQMASLPAMLSFTGGNGKLKGGADRWVRRHKDRQRQAQTTWAS